MCCGSHSQSVVTSVQSTSSPQSTSGNIAMSTRLTLVTLLSAALTLVPAASSPSFIENDSIVFPDTDNETVPSEISEKLKECIQDNQKIEFNGICRALLTTDGACPDDYWLVLDLQSASLPKPVVKGKCAPRKCPPKLHYWTEQNRCVSSNDSAALCPAGNSLSTDYFGEGFCECVKDPVHARDRDGRCYPVFTQGPCPDGKVWARGTNTRMECAKDECKASRSRYGLGEKILAPWTDGRCYPVNERGPCVAGHVIHINPWSMTPECGDPISALHLVDPPCTGVDHTGKCSQPVSTPQNLFYSQIAEQVRKKRTRKGLSSPK